MSDDTNNVNVEEVDASEATEITNESTDSNIVNDLETIKQELEAKKELIKQLRKYEKSQKEEKEAALAEQGKYKELWEQSQQKIREFEDSFKNSSIDAAIKTAAEKFGVKSLTTLQKIIDKSAIEFDDNHNVNVESINKILETLQKTDAILFELPKVQTPELKVASDDVTTLNYETELRKATSQSAIEAIMAKYGKL